MKNTIFLLIIFIATSCSNQDSYSPIDNIFFEQDENVPLQYSSYNAILPNQLDPLFFEDFSNNNFGWQENDDKDNTFNIENGVLTYTSKSKYLYYKPINVDGIQSNSDFQIEVELKIKQSKESDMICSFNWGGKGGWDNVYLFGITKDKQYAILWQDNNEWQDNIVSLTEHSAIKGDFNKLTIRYIDGVHYFFINEIFILKKDNLYIYGNEIGPSVGSKITGIFDNINISSISK